MSENIRWSQMSDADIIKIKREKCNKCYYGRKTSSPSKNYGKVYCDYITIEGHPRGCRPEECDKFRR